MIVTCSRKKVVAVLAGVAMAGLAVWLGFGMLTGTREAWDRSLFFMVGVPLMALITAAAGRYCPRSRFLAGVAIVSLQLVALVYLAPKGTWRIALVGGGIFFLMFALLCTGTAIAGALSRAELTQHPPPGRRP